VHPKGESVTTFLNFAFSLITSFMLVYRILIDDRLDLMNAWQEQGGIFIHHTCAKTTLQKLEQRGVLTKNKIKIPVLS